jgi:hypothetical protein
VDGARGPGAVTFDGAPTVDGASTTVLDSEPRTDHRRL